MCSHKLKELSRRRPKPIRPGAQLISAEHLWKPFWKRVNNFVNDNGGAQHRFLMRNDERSPRSWTAWGRFNHGIDSVIGSDVRCRARVDELKIVDIDRPLLLMNSITEGVEIIFLLTGTVEIDASLSEVDLKGFIWKVPGRSRLSS
jgi:hypothetical protein